MRSVAPEDKLPVQSLGRDRRRLVVGLPDNRAGVWRPMTEMMRAFVIEDPGGPEKLELRELPRPKPRDGWVLIHNRAFGLNRSECRLALHRLAASPIPAAVGRQHRARA